MIEEGGKAREAPLLTGHFQSKGFGPRRTNERTEADGGTSSEGDPFNVCGGGIKWNFMTRIKGTDDGAHDEDDDGG